MSHTLTGRDGDRVFSYDLLRVLAAAAVICLHTAAFRWSAQGAGSPSWRIFNLYEGAVRWSVPVFVMLSGALLLDGERAGSRSMARRAGRIVTAFLFWSAVYALAGADWPPVWGDVLKQLVLGHYHMWYLYMILGLYILTPVLRQIAASPAAARYFLLMALLFNFLLPRLLGLGQFIGVPWLVQSLDTLRTAYDKMSLQLPVGYTGYFVLGHYLTRNPVRPGARRVIYLLGALGLCHTIGLTAAIADHTGQGTEYFYSNYDPGVMLTATAVFVLGLYALPRTARPAIRRWTTALSRYSFGAYLVHPLVLTTLRRQFGLDTLSFAPALAVPVISLLVFVLSMAISAVLNHVPVLKKHIV